LEGSSTGFFRSFRVGPFLGSVETKSESIQIKQCLYLFLPNKAMFVPFFAGVDDLAGVLDVRAGWIRVACFVGSIFTTGFGDAFLVYSS